MYSVVTFFSMTIPMALWAVKRMAFIIMIAPTGTLVFRAARLTIHPLRRRNEHIKNKRGGGDLLISSFAPGLKKQPVCECYPDNCIYTWS